MDFVQYYPKQNIPDGFCGLASCGGELLETAALSAESDFDRTFGVISTTCVTDEEEVEEEEVEEEEVRNR